MKYIWEPSDIKTGRMVYKQPSYHGFNEDNWRVDGRVAKWVFKIGFCDAACGVEGVDSANLCLINMIDGMVSPTGQTRAGIADLLNKDEMIPIPHGRLIEVMNYLRED